MSGRITVVMLLFLACSGVMEAVAAAPAFSQRSTAPQFELQPSLPLVSRMLSGRHLKDYEYAQHLATLQSNIVADVDIYRALSAMHKMRRSVNLDSLGSIVFGLHRLLDELVPNNSKWIKQISASHENPWVRGLAMFPNVPAMQNVGEFFNRLGEFKKATLIPSTLPKTDMDPDTLRELDRLLLAHMERVVESDDLKSFLIHHAQLVGEFRDRPKLQMIVTNISSPSQWMSLVGSLPALRDHTFNQGYVNRVNQMNQRLYPDGGWADLTFLQTDEGEGQEGLEEDADVVAPPPAPPLPTSTNATAKTSSSDEEIAEAEQQQEEVDSKEEVIYCSKGAQDLSCSMDKTIRPLYLFGVMALVVGSVTAILDDKARDQAVSKPNPSSKSGKDCIEVGPDVAKYLPIARILTLEQSKYIVCDREMIGDVGVILLNIALWCFVVYIFIAFVVASKEAAAYYSDALPDVKALIDQEELVRKTTEEQGVSMIELESKLKLQSRAQSRGGWKELQQDNGEPPYYWNQDSGEVAWELPQGANVTTDVSTGAVDPNALPGDINNYSAEQQETLKTMIKTALVKNKGKLSLNELKEALDYLDYPQEEKLEILGLLSSAKVGSKGLFKKGLQGTDWNGKLQLSVANINSMMQFSNPSLSGEMRNNAISSMMATILWIITFVCMCSTNDATAVLIALTGIPLLHFGVYYQNNVFKKSKETAKQLETEEAGDNAKDAYTALNSAYKIMVVLVCINMFAVVYFFSNRCLEPTVHCPVEGTKPVCRSTGLPPSRYQCAYNRDSNGDSVCNYKGGSSEDVKGNSTCETEVGSLICLHEEVPFGKYDDGFYKDFWIKQSYFSDAHSPILPVSRQVRFYESLSPIYYIGLTDIADQCVTDNSETGNPERFLKFKNDVHYVYAESSMETLVQNLFASMNHTLLPAMDQPHGIEKVALVNGEYSCSDDGQRGSAKAIDPMLNTTLDLISTPKLTVFTPDGGVGNFRMCYFTADGDASGKGSWKAVPNSWVIVGETGSCGAMNCDGADFSDGMGAHFSDALYYSLITQSTIGYGDILAMSTRARMMTAMQALVMMFIDLL